MSLDTLWRYCSKGCEAACFSKTITPVKAAHYRQHDLCNSSMSVMFPLREFTRDASAATSSSTGAFAGDGWSACCCSGVRKHSPARSLSRIGPRYLRCKMSMNTWRHQSTTLLTIVKKYRAAFNNTTHTLRFGDSSRYSNIDETIICRVR